jgi:hypothetical protein
MGENCGRKANPNWFAPQLRQQYAERWAAAIRAFDGYPRVLQVIFYQSPVPAGERTRAKAVAAGMRKPHQAMKFK